MRGNIVVFIHQYLTTTSATPIDARGSYFGVPTVDPGFYFNYWWVLLLQSIDSEEDLIVKPVSLGNVNIIRSLSEYRGNNIRTIEQAELAIIVSRAHFKVGTAHPILASLQRRVYKVTQTLLQALFV